MASRNGEVVCNLRTNFQIGLIASMPVRPVSNGATMREMNEQLTHLCRKKYCPVFLPPPW
jgi:hypothetical protein